MKKKKLTIIMITAVLAILIVVVGYECWNAADPNKSCASCHEISPSVLSNLTSAHRNIACSECHGTALSNGVHSIQEKLNMLLTHFTDKPKKDENIRMSETQIVDVMTRCESCHRTQFADWKSGGHSATYEHIFMDEAHNKMEPPYWDCLRCHGMYYKGTIYDLMQPVDNQGPWSFKDPAQADVPTIPCLTCHKIHAENDVRGQAQAFADPKNIFYQRDQRNIPFGLYMRADAMFLRADQFTTPTIYKDGAPVSTPTEWDYRLCVQCHSPNSAHQAGTEDDHTPTGVHEGITCNACHAPHSNDATNSCGTCHPAISNCGLDVASMNTSFNSADSPHDIHAVACVDCHVEGMPD